MSEEQPIRRVRARLGFSNDLIRVFDDEVTRHGRPGRHLRVESALAGRGVVMLAAADGRFALVRTYRYPVGVWQWALPRGFSQADRSEESARAELAEELGVETLELRLLGSISPDSGFIADLVDVYAARVSHRSSVTADPDEVREIRWLTAAELLAEIAAGAITDGFTLATVALASAQGILGRDGP